MRLASYIEAHPYAYILIPTVFAVAVRLTYHFLSIPDFWGDSYHNIYISLSTIENGWVYSDYKGREVVWLPFYRYLSSLILFLSGSDKMFWLHILNMFLGSLSCGLVAFLVRKEVDKEYGMLSGIFMAMLPWHIAYSHMNMPEITGSIILLLVVFSVHFQKWWWLVVLGFIGALTKNEVTLYIGVFGLYIIWIKEWRSLFALASGTSLGLLVWGLWNYDQTGNFFWWITERSVGSSWDKLFYAHQESGSWYIPFLSILQVFPFILVLAFYGQKIIPSVSFRSDKFLLGITGVVIFNWGFIMIMNFGYFPSPDARYFILTLPLTCISFALWMSKLDIPLKKMHRILIAAFVIMLFQVPSFYFLSYTLKPIMEVGNYIRNESLNESIFWNDFPTSGYFGEIPWQHSLSSVELAPKEIRETGKFSEQLADHLKTNKVKYIIFQDVPYTYLGTIWPQMKVRNEFNWMGMRFVRVFYYEFEANQGVIDRVRALGVGGRTASLWRVEYPL